MIHSDNHEMKRAGDDSAPITADTRIYGSGEMADRTRQYDWSSTPLGPISGWSDALVIIVNSALANQHPNILFWGDSLIQIYNDAAIPVLGPDKHPTALGQRGDVSWAEVWPIVGIQIEGARKGVPFWTEDQFAPVFRRGHLEDAWWTYSYSPVRDAAGAIQGVLITTLETTRRVMAERAFQNERTRLLALFQQAPAFFAVLRGPDHVFEMTNSPYTRLVGGRDVLGRAVREAVPEAVPQGYVDLLDEVFTTGVPFVGQDQRLVLESEDGSGPEELYLDFVYQPLREPDGTISGIIVLGVNMTDRKRTTEALLQSERSAASVLASITDGFHLVDAKGRFQQFNAAAKEIYAAQGIDAESLLGREVSSVFPDLAETEHGKNLYLALNERKASSFESYYEPWNRWFSVRHFPTSTGGVATFFQDITERKRTESLLWEQRERFDFATDAAQIGYWFCDLPFDKLSWDARVKEHFWLPPDAEVDIVKFYKILHVDDRERTRKAIDESIARHTRYDIEYRTMSPNGEFKWIRAFGRTAYDVSEKPIYFDGVTQDITALKLAQEGLDAERRRLSAVFENVPVGLVFTEANGRIVSRNRQAERILGYTPHDEHSDTYRDWVTFHPEGRRLEWADHPLTLALTEGGMQRGEYIFIRKDGVRVWVEFTGAPIRDMQGSVIGAVIAIADIDARKRAEEALIRSEKLAVVGRLAATISHEINNPLEAVTNLLYLIHENTSEDSAKHFSKLAQEELARVSHIVTHTLRFNRQTNGALAERLSDVVESALAIYEVRLKNASIELKRDYAEAERVLCFGSELRQVFANLIGNSFDATKQGGILFLRTHDQTNWRTGERGVRVAIADTGHGMDEKTRRRLFEPFFTTKGDNGTGLGLWVSREILNKHKALLRLRTRSEPGPSGTVFSIWFPLNAPLEGEIQR